MGMKKRGREKKRGFPSAYPFYVVGECDVPRYVAR